jgi:hypothetical protein
MSSIAWHCRVLALLLLVPLAVWAAVTSVVVKIDRDVRHPETQQTVRIAQARTIIEIHANPNDASLVDLTFTLDATGTALGSQQTYRLFGSAKGTFKKATQFPNIMPITCPVQFISEKQSSGHPAIVVMGEVVEPGHGDPVFALRQVLVPQQDGKEMTP